MTHGNWKTTAKRLLSRTGLLPAARELRYQTRRATDSTFRAHEQQVEQEFRRFADQYGAAFRQVAPAQQEGRRVLIVSSGSLGQLVEIALVTAFRAAGYRPMILGDYDRWMEAYYREVGVPDQRYWDEWFKPVPQAEAAALLGTIGSFEQLIKLEYAGTRVGKYAASTALRHLRVGRIDLADRGIKDALLPFLHRAMCDAETARAIVEELRPHLVLSVDLGYSPRGQLFDVCLAAGIDTITWNAAHRNNTLMLKRYNRVNRDVHPASLSAHTWRTLTARPWTDQERERLRQELIGSYQSGEWYSEVGTQFRTSLREAEEVRRTLDLDPGKKTVVVFPHIFWDGTFFYGTDLFESYEEWFVETMRVAYANSRVNWVVKIHPANLVKNIRDGIGSEPSELAALRSLGQNLPSQVRLVPPDSPISTLSLYAIMDCCVTVRGTVGIEAASFGIPVLTAGTGRYDRLGFTIDSASRAQYLDRLAHIDSLPPMTGEQRRLAEQFAYGIFVLRPLTLRTVALEYQRDAKASLRTMVRVPTSSAVREAPDLRALAEWVRSGEEDFIAPHV
ncbi:MAG: hypothetical protein NBKEAIPA_02145 [Nitrospirae bacterium]|nr:hypothetical protein [Nitrospirota bacterium]MCE7964262.1 hypothetical protein [Nitrospira sp. NTP2]MCK6492661.1 hypothetical protein [Nitrospira sp.]MEB2337268.1 hypothetical protein [Nitrospirales bacterium]QOJ36665.1 MAG: hypothetical protein HRU82_17665 [Nitrospira sp.]